MCGLRWAVKRNQAGEQGEAGLGGGKRIVLQRRTRKVSEVAPLE